MSVSWKHFKKQRQVAWELCSVLSYDSILLRERHRSLFELQGLGWHLHTFRLPAMLGHAAHTQKGGFWLYFFISVLFFLSALICRFPLRVLSRSLPLPDGMPITPVKWSSLSIALYIRYFPPPFDALILLATCWDRAFTFPWVPNETVEGVSRRRRRHGADWTLVARVGRRFTWKWWIVSMWFVAKTSQVIFLSSF